MTDQKSLHKKFEQVLAEYGGILLKVSRGYCPRADEREDLIQEMKIQIWRALPRYNGCAALSTWLYRICLNVAISHYRKNAHRQEKEAPLEEALHVVASPSTTEQEQALMHLDRFIQELNALDKALMLLYLEEKSQAEIADILGISVSNVSTKVGRIKEKLKKRFNQQNL